jgi:hypothetical protein
VQVLPKYFSNHYVSVAGILLTTILLLGTLLSSLSSPLAAYAQGQQISGKYRNVIAGYEITFPKGWSGDEFLGVSVFAAPRGIDPLKEFPGTYMAIIHFNLTQFIQKAQNNTVQFTQFDNSTTINCTTISERYVSINNIRSAESVKECHNNINGEFSKTKDYFFATKQFIITAGFSANSTGSYDKYVGAFDSSVKTLKLNNQMDFKPLLKKVAGSKTVTQKVDGKDIKIETTSILSGFKLDNSKRTLTFSVEGKKNSPGLTEVSIGQILKGPYQVTIDGKKSNNFRTIEDTTSGEALVGISYNHDTRHTITIIGSQGS